MAMGIKDDNVIIAKLSSSINETSGIIDSDTTKEIKIVIKNTGTSDIKVNIGVAYSGSSSLNLPNNRFLITDTITGKYVVTTTIVNGSISNSTIIVDKGNSTSLNVSPNDNHVFESLNCNNSESVYSDGVLSINNITNDVTCTLNFVELTPEYVLTKLNLTVNSGSPDFSSIATTDEGVYAGTDDYGNTYFFRGDVEDNYLFFAGYYWRIVRINGNGSIRIIYDGTTIHNNDDYSSDRLIGSGAFNTSRNGNQYVGYMYTDGEVHGYSTPSNIKMLIDEWYSANILINSIYADRIDEEVGFCGDRNPSTSPTGQNGSGGTGRTTTYYAAYFRLYSSSSPSFSCSNSGDLYTTSNSSSGNHSLNYPIGLITADEVAAAGAKYGEINPSQYLNIGQFYWTMTPIMQSMMAGAYEYIVGDEGDLYWGLFYGYTVDDSLGIRPVINLKADTNFSGSGTIDDPYIVEY